MLNYIPAATLATLDPATLAAKGKAAKVTLTDKKTGKVLALWIDPARDAAAGGVLMDHPPKPKPTPPPPPPEWGLGTLAAKGIDLTTLGLGKAIAQRVAAIFGKKTCGCAERARCLNERVPDVRAMTAADWLLKSPGLFLCLAARAEGPPPTAQAAADAKNAAPAVPDAAAGGANVAAQNRM